MDTGAGSLAIGELIGAAFFIVAVVAGCMGIIKPFQSQKITFMRDASFLTGAIMIITWIVYHQSIYWYHSVLLISYYLCYVSVVVFGAYSSNNNNEINDYNQKSEQISSKSIINEATHLLYKGGMYDGWKLYFYINCILSSKGNQPLKLTIPAKGFSVQSNMSDYNGQNHLGHIIKPMSPNSSRPSFHFDAISRSTSVNGSISSKTYRRPMTPRIGIRTSVFGAIEVRANFLLHRVSYYIHHYEAFKLN